MADYTQNTLFGPKDALSTGDPAKLVKGTEFDTEFSEIASAISTKYDSGDIASNLAAAALTDDTVLLTPAKLLYALENGTFTLSSTATSPLESRTLTAGNGLTGGGTLAADRTFNVGAGTGISVSADAVALSHLGLESLTDPNADRIAFWDDSAGAFAWLTIGTGLSITGTTLSASGGGSAVWGSITGTLDDQMDLYFALLDKVDKSGNASSITPGSTLTYSLGWSDAFWLDLYVGEINLGSTGSTLTELDTGQIGVENKAVLTHNGAYTSGQVYFSTGTPTGGNNGDIWFEYTA